MKINLFNKNVDNARFEICWGENDSTSAIALDPGDTASFDMDVFNQIPEGADWWVKGYQVNTDLYKFSTENFKYISGFGFSGTFNLLIKDIDLVLTYRKPVNLK